MRVLLWEIPKEVEHLSPDGLKILKYENRNVVLVWFRNKVVVYDNLQGLDLKSGDTCPNITHVCTVQEPVINILQLGEVIGVFDGIALYLLVKLSEKLVSSTSRKKQSLSLKMHMKMNDVLALDSLLLGFSLVKRKSLKLFVDVYKTGSRLTSLEKKLSVQLPEPTCGNTSCILTSVSCADLEPVLSSLLLEDLSLLCSQLIFVGLSCGQVYCIPASTEKNPTFKYKSRLLYSATQCVMGIVFIRDTERSLYSCVGIILNSGSLVYIMAVQQKLHYNIIYLPGVVEVCCSVNDGILATDGIDLWHSKLTWNTERQPVIENTTLDAKGVYALDSIPDSTHILAITGHSTVYCLDVCSPTKTSPSHMKNLTVPPSFMVDMDNRLAHLNNLKKQITFEESMLEVISINSRRKLLQNTFKISVQVNGAGGGNDTGYYEFIISLLNADDQDYCPELWYLFVSISVEGVNSTETSKLKQRFQKGVKLKTCFTVNIPETVSNIDVSCALITKFPGESKADSTLWAVIPIASESMDISYLFNSKQSEKHFLSRNLLTIAAGHVINEMLQLKMSKEIIANEQEFTSTFGLSRKISEPHNLWCLILKNCGHRFTNVTTGKELNLYVGYNLVKMSMNDTRDTTIELKCGSIELLHNIKRCLSELLNRSNISEKHIMIKRIILDKIMELKTVVEVEETQFHLLREDWRHTAEMYLPFA